MKTLNTFNVNNSNNHVVHKKIFEKDISRYCMLQLSKINKNTCEINLISKFNIENYIVFVNSLTFSLLITLHYLHFW